MYRWDPQPTRPSAEVTRIAATLRRPARVLDAGCGARATDARYLAALGHQVDAFDSDGDAVNHALTIPPPENGRLRIWQADLRFVELDAQYDLILCRGVLHFLTVKERANAMKCLQRSTKRRGLHALAVFDEHLPIPQDLAALVPSPVSSHELEYAYRGWRIEKGESYVLNDEHAGGIRHRHSILRFNARRLGD
jgi:SAM-dependent methyltransferase